MGRRKKLTETELENTQTTLTIEDSNQAESEEAELLAETDSEVVAEAIPQEEIEAIVEKPRKPRKPRAKKEAELKVEAEIPTPEPVSSSEDSWAAIKQLSESVALLVEQTKKNQLPPPSIELDTNEFLRPAQPAPKTLFITKFATAASIVAILLSLVSLSLSQSARQAALGSLESVKQADLGIASKSSSNSEEALPFRRNSRRNR
ncbi:MAG: hypothetical protein ACKN9V_00965 [Pseudomonadota bacterium]